jgi:tetratricopeptide (TPR) repeat protein
MDAAINHYREMLTLNPNDNQGIRYGLAACFLRKRDDAALKELLATYPNEASIYWAYTRALIAFREGGADDAQAAALAKEAWAENEHVPAILAGTKRPVLSSADYLTVGGPEEASSYCAEFGAAWHTTPSAVKWLTRITAGLARTRPAIQ